MSVQELEHACYTNDVEKVKQLIELKADINGVFGFPVYYASKLGHAEVLTCLIQNKADISSNDFSIPSGMYSACEQGRIEIVKLLLENKANINSEYLFKSVSVIVVASEKNNLELVKLLLENRANVNASDDRSIITASKNGNLEMVKLLVENKANIHAKNGLAIRYASENKHKELIKFLLSEGADSKKLCPKYRKLYLKNKYFRKWRLFVLRNFIRHTIIPLYYSPGFPGGEKIKKELGNLFPR